MSKLVSVTEKWRVVAHVDRSVALRVNIVEIYFDIGAKPVNIVSHRLTVSL